MPSTPLRPCPGQGGRCPNRVPKGRCPACTKAKDRERGTFRQRWGGLYDSRWSKYSRMFRSEFPLCGMRPDGKPPVMSECWEMRQRNPNTGVVAATQTDHVVPHKGDPQKFWDRGNHQALCTRCGTRKTQAGL